MNNCKGFCKHICKVLELHDERSADWGVIFYIFATNCYISKI